MNKEKQDMNGLGRVDKVVDMGGLEDTEDKQTSKDLPLSDEEEKRLKKKLEKIRKVDPFIYR